MLKISKQKSWTLVALIVGASSLVYVLSQDDLDTQPSSSTRLTQQADLKVTDETDKPSGNELAQVVTKTQRSVKTKMVSNDSEFASKASPDINNTKNFRPISKDFKDQIRKIEQLRASLQLKRTLPDGTVVIDTVKSHTSATVVVLTEDGEPVQGHGGLVLNAPEKEQ